MLNFITISFSVYVKCIFRKNSWSVKDHFVMSPKIGGVEVDLINEKTRVAGSSAHYRSGSGLIKA